MRVRALVLCLELLSGGSVILGLGGGRGGHGAGDDERVGSGGVVAREGGG